MAQVLKLVSFGSAKGGLATVGYTIYGLDGAVIATRSTAGVVEIGTNTGVYSAPVSMPDYDAIVLWDTGEGTPKYASESYIHQVDAIRADTARISQIWNSIKNIYEFQAILMDKLGLIQKNEGLVKVNDKLDTLSAKDIPDKSTIEELFNRSIAKITIPEFKQKDYTGEIENLKAEVKSILAELSKVPKAQKDYTPNLNSLVNRINALENSLKPSKQVIDNSQENMKLLNTKLNNLASALGNMAGILGEIQGNDTKQEKRKQDMITEIQKVIQYLNRLAMTKNDTSILTAFGHLR